MWYQRVKSNFDIAICVNKCVNLIGCRHVRSYKHTHTHKNGAWLKIIIINNYYYLSFMLLVVFFLAAMPPCFVIAFPSMWHMHTARLSERKQGKCDNSTHVNMFHDHIRSSAQKLNIYVYILQHYHCFASNELFEVFRFRIFFFCLSFVWSLFLMNISLVNLSSVFLLSIVMVRACFVSRTFSHYYLVCSSSFSHAQ